MRVPAGSGVVTRLDLSALILDRRAYHPFRTGRRAAITPIKRARRVPVGDKLMFEFENEQTLAYQVQEMLYAENIASEIAAQHELDTYARLLPTENSVCATMFVELTDPATVREDLDQLDGVHQAIHLEIGDMVIPAEDVPPPDEGESERTYSVHFLRFVINAHARALLADLTVPAALTVDHPRYQASGRLRAEVREQLLTDLAVAEAA